MRDGCRCFDCLVAGRPLGEIAPRIARATVEAAEARRQAGRDRLARRRELLRLERLVEYRELQLVRAGASRRSAYIADRQRKLETARRLLAQAKARAAA